MKITLVHIDTGGDDNTTSLVVQSLQAIRTAIQPATSNGHRLQAASAPVPRQIDAPLAAEPEPAPPPAADKKPEPEPEAKARKSKTVTHVTGDTDLCACGAPKLVTSLRCRSCAAKRAAAMRRKRKQEADHA